MWTEKILHQLVDGLLYPHYLRYQHALLYQYVDLFYVYASCARPALGAMGSESPRRVLTHLAETS